MCKVFLKAVMALSLIVYPCQNGFAINMNAVEMYGDSLITTLKCSCPSFGEIEKIILNIGDEDIDDKEDIEKARLYLKQTFDSINTVGSSTNFSDNSSLTENEVKSVTYSEVERNFEELLLSIKESLNIDLSKDMLLGKEASKVLSLGALLGYVSCNLSTGS